MHSEKPRTCRMLMAVSCVLRADNKAELNREKPSLDPVTTQYRELIYRHLMVIIGDDGNYLFRCTM